MSKAEQLQLQREKEQENMYSGREAIKLHTLTSVFVKIRSTPNQSFYSRVSKTIPFKSEARERFKVTAWWLNLYTTEGHHTVFCFPELIS